MYECHSKRLICDQLAPLVQKRTTKFRTPVPICKRAMLTLWRLATNIEYRTLGHLFGVGRGTVCVIFHEIIDAINTILQPRYLKFPCALVDNLYEISLMDIEHIGTFPQCCGAIDSTHISIIAPKEHHTDYYNRKCHHFVIIQGVVDYIYRFTNINVGHAGKHHDAHVLRESPLFRKACAGQLLPRWTETIDNTEIPLFLIGDPAYPLLLWLMKAYSGNHLTAEQRIFNYRISRARMTVECAFGRLKGRLRYLLKRLDNDLPSVSGIVKACCTLHNICEIHGEYFDENWLDGVVAENAAMPNVQNHNNGTTDAKAIRSAITNWLKYN